MNLIAHVEIPVRELERAIAFYSAVFGIGFGDIVEIHGSRMAWFPFTSGEDGASGALAQGEVYVPSTDGAILYFAVDPQPCDHAGQHHSFPKTELSETSFVAEITDSEGNRIALQTI